MKRIATIITGLMLALALTSCGNTNESSNTESKASTTQAVQQSETEKTDEVSSKEESASDKEKQTESAANEETSQNEDTSKSVQPEKTEGKTLVVYFSASGNTKAVSEYIAQAANADTFELVPVEPYTDDDLNWTVDGSRVNKEHDDESLRDIKLEKTTLENWDEYDTIFVGYPIWWGIAAWPVDNFIKENDFSGKTVIPFCTSTSSGMGESGTLLSQMAGSGDWQEGMRFQSGADQSEVTEWVKGLGV